MSNRTLCTGCAKPSRKSPPEGPRGPLPTRADPAPRVVPSDRVHGVLPAPSVGPNSQPGQEGVPKGRKLQKDPKNRTNNPRQSGLRDALADALRVSDLRWGSGVGVLCRKPTMRASSGRQRVCGKIAATSSPRKEIRPGRGARPHATYGTGNGRAQHHEDSASKKTGVATLCRLRGGQRSSRRGKCSAN